MQSNQEQDFGSLLNNFSGSEPQGQTTDSQDFGSLLNAQSTPQQPKARPTGKPSIDDAISQEGADHLKPVIAALYGQESGSGATQRTSTDGARGGMQIMPDTFRRYARPGERIDDPTDNMRVGVRIVKTLGDKFNNDPAKIATAYFSGDGNVNTGSGNAWKHDHADGNGKRVSSYVNDVVNRMGGSQLQLGSSKPTEKDPIDSIPDWKDVEQKPEYQAFTPTEKQQAKEAYFDRFVAPVAGNQAGKLREQFLATNERGWGQAAVDTGRNVAAGLLKIGPTAVKGAADIANMATGDKYDLGVSKQMETGMQAINQFVGTERFNQQQSGFNQIMQDDTRGIGDMFAYMIENPAILVDNTISTVGSMFLPAGAAKGAVTAARAIGAGKAAATKAAVATTIGTAAAQNAADTFGELKDQPIDRRYEGAAVSAALSILAGIVTGGGAEGAIARTMADDLKSGKIGVDAVKGFLKAAFKEGAQESGEEIGNVTGESFGSQSFPNVQNAAKRTTFAGTVGGLMGGGADLLFNQSVTPDGRLEQSATGQTATAAEPAPIDVHPTTAAADAVVNDAINQFGVPDHVVASDLTPSGPPATSDDDVMNFAESRLNELLTKQDGTIETVMGETGPTDQEVPGVGLSNAEQAELDALLAAQGDAKALRTLYGFDRVNVPSDQSQNATQGNIPAPPQGSISQPEAGQVVPTATEPALEAAQNEENQRQTQELGLAPSTGTSEPIGGSIGTTDQSQPANNPAGTQNNVSNPVGNAGQQNSAVQTNDAVDKYADIPDIGSPSNVSEAEGMRLLGFSEQEIEEATAKPSKIGPSGTVKEPIENILAQVKAYANGSRGPVFVDSNKGLTESVLRDNGMRVMQSKFGGFYVVKKSDAQSIADIEKNNDKETARAQILGYVQSKNEINTATPVTVVQATDANGAVVHEQAVNQDRQAEAEANAAPIAQANGGVVNVTTPEQAIKGRNANEQAQENQAAQAKQTQAQEQKAPVAGGGVGKVDKPSVLYTDNPTVRDARSVETVAAENAEDAVDLNKQQTGWKYLELPNGEGAILVSSDGKKTVTFRKPAAKSGSDSLMVRTEASAWAIDNPYTTKTKPTTEKQARAQKDYSEKWFGSQDKAQAFINKQGIGESHEVAQDGKRFVIKARGGEVEQTAEALAVKQPTTEKAAKAQREDSDLPQGWAAAGKGIATNNDPQTGGIVDKAIASGKWFAIPNKEGVPQLEGFDTRKQAIDALQKAVAADSNKAKPTANTVFTEDAAEKARAILKSKLGQLNSGIDPEIMQAGITLAGYHIEKGARTFAAYSKAMIDDMGDVVKPYLKSWYLGVKFDPRAAGFDGMDDASVVEKADVEAVAPTKATSKQFDLHAPEGKFEVAKQVSDHFLGGGKFDTIVQARKFISDITGVEIKPATELAKQADETIETAVVLASREIVEAGRKQGRSSAIIYDRLLDLFNRQPNLSVRSSESVRNQAYSTPAPLAYVASELAGVTGNTKMIESTAGNGMLAIGASTKNAVVNELNPKRAAMLKAMGFDVTIQNAATQTLAPAKSIQSVVINPPFGATKDDNGETIVYEIKPNYGTREVDHAIVFKTLDTMKDDGKAVLIVGGVNETDEERRREDYRGKSKRTFYYNLYNDYNVTDHFTVDGKLYTKQGASYPVDVIVIDGRGKSARDLPAAQLPAIILSYEELKGKLNGKQGSVGAGVVSTNGVDSGAGQSGGSNGTGVGGSTNGQSNGNGTSVGQSSTSNTASVPVSGDAANGRTATSGGVSVQGKSESTGVSERSDGQSVSNASKGKRSSTPSDRGNGVGELGGTSVVAGERVGNGLSDRRGEEQETETQVAYTPHSGAASVGTLVPKAMRDAINASLSKIEDQVGSIDQYVADNLGLDTQEVSKYFSAEQVDALALSIRNAEAGRGFIIGDQTGIGKGRVVAAMIKYALVNGKTPIFVTEKPNLYADMIRDLDDIGMTQELALDTAKPKVLITNGGESIPYTLLRTENGEVTETNLTLRAPKSGAALDKIMVGMRGDDSLGDYKVIFTTYSQLQTVKGKDTERQKFVRHFGNSNYMIFDESHNAGGGGETQARTKGQRDARADFLRKEGRSLVLGRAAFVRELVDIAFGTFFSSATYAKRPDVMDLYSSTNMKLAVNKISDLGDAIKHGGVPMQQAVANMLTTDGQYIRRERTFAGVSYDTVETKVDRETAENMASAMRSILAFSRAKEAVVKQMQKELDKAGGVVKGMGEKTTVQSATFGSIMHNLIDQMLLSLKAQDSVKHAIERLKSGEKVVMTVSNTMGSFLKDYADEMGLKTGDPVGLSFKDLYMRYLDRQRVVKIKLPNGEIKEHRLTDNELGPRLSEMFAKVRDQIENAGFGSAPISPIDYLHSELQKAGFKTDEITGRNMTLDYSSGTPILSTRNSTIRQRVGAVRGFNNGDTDVIILNQAGSTGLSLHASSKVKDQRKRHMIIVQAEKNIDTHMQMLGRVHRTGQVIAPAYSQMMADIPAEMRPASVLMKKMASLSANTTASRKSSVTAEGVVDFMNDYGGQVVHEYLRDNQEVLEALGGSKVVDVSDNSEDGTEEDIRKFTGYIPILPIKQQEEIYADLIDRYNELIERENALGTNKLEAKAIDLDAKTLSSTQITENKGVQSVFAEPASMEQVDVKRSVRPLSSAEVQKLVDERLDGKQPDAIADDMKTGLKERASKFAQARIKQFTEAGMDEITLGRHRDSLTAIYNNTLNILNNYSIGDKIVVSDKEGYRMYGVITDIVNRASTANPAAGSSWKMHIAVANGESKTITLSFSQIGSRYTLGKESTVNWYNPESKTFENMPLLNVFDLGATTRREKRWIVTGNILAGFARHPGQIITYTKDDGTTTQGVLMNRQFDFAAVQKNAPVTMRSADDAMRFLNEVSNAMVGIDGEQGIEIIRRYGNYQFSAPAAKSKGGAIYLDKRLTDALGTDFYKRGKFMIASVDDEYQARAALEYLIKDRGEPIVALTQTEKAKEMFRPAQPKPSRNTASTANPHDVASLTDRLRGVADKENGDGFFDALVGTGKFKVVTSSEIAHLSNDARDQAFYNPADDTSYFVSDRISKNASNDYLHGLLLHEVSVHAMKLGQDDAAFAKIKDQFSKMRRVSPAVATAYEKAEKAGTPSDEEALGYFVEANPKSSITQRLIAWIKSALRRMGLSTKWTNSLSEADVIAMASSALRRAPNAEKNIYQSDNNDIRFSKISTNVKNNLVQFFGNQHGKSLKTWNTWDKTLATQYHKALKDKHFGKVFNLINAMQNEVSLTSIRPAELAPGILPRVDDIKTAARVLIKGKKADSNMDKAANALFAGTLAGENVMAGKVWSDAELRNNFGLNDTGIALYNQARAAIDASLDEVAAAEGFAMAQGFIAKSLRAQVINNPQIAESLILEALERQVRTLDLAIDAAKLAGNEAQAASLGESRKAFNETITNVERIFTTARNLKMAGYAPLMRFGKFSVLAQAVDPVTGNVEKDVNGESITLFYGQYETEGEAKSVRNQLESKYADRDDVRVTSGVKSQSAHELYAGISPETLALFADAVGQGATMKKYYQLALTERSALKRRLERKGTAGFSSDMPRVLSNFITSNGRFAAQRYYLRDLNSAIKYIPKEKGDVLDEAIALKRFIVNPNDPAAPVSSVLFAWFLGGSVASAAINLTQPVMMTGPYLSQFGVKEATAALTHALPYALGKKQITDSALKEGLKRASQEGIVDAQEIFHLYSVGAQSVASGLVNSLSRLPGVGKKIKAGSESARARTNAFLTLWGSMFSTAESFNRKLTFIAAWKVAEATKKKKPYDFAVRAVNETQGIYNKVNRPNLARGPVGRVVMTFKQYSIMYAELLSRMYKHGGPEGKRAALIMLGVLMLAAGEEGLPFAQDLDDLIDTLGQAFGLDTNMRRNKRRVAHELIGEKMGDLFLYGISSQLPIDFAGRMGMGNLIPGTSILKPSDEQGRNRQVEEVFGAGAGMIGQIADAYDAATEGNWGKAGQNMMPTAIKNLAASVQMAGKGYATDARGRKVVETNGLDALGKAIGFNPTKVAEETRRTAPVQQDIALQKKTEASIVDQWAQGAADNDQALMDKAAKRLNDWNESNPKTPISINAEQIRAKSRQLLTDKNNRLLKTTPREMRGTVGLDLIK